MKSIWKFTLYPTERQSVVIPRGAEVISAQVQGNDICIWATVDTEAKKDLRTISIYGTGHILPEKVGRFIDTVQMGALVFHVFEED